jgi:hypothetical protein
MLADSNLDIWLCTGDTENRFAAGCGAYNNKGGSCHTFFDEIGDLLSKKQVGIPAFPLLLISTFRTGTLSMPVGFQHGFLNQSLRAGGGAPRRHQGRLLRPLGLEEVSGAVRLTAALAAVRRRGWLHFAHCMKEKERKRKKNSIKDGGRCGANSGRMMVKPQSCAWTRKARRCVELKGT